MAMTEQDDTYLMDLDRVAEGLAGDAAGGGPGGAAAPGAGAGLSGPRRPGRDHADPGGAAGHDDPPAGAGAHHRADGAETRRQQEALTQQWQQVVRQAARVQRWLPWKVALLLLVGTLLVNAGGIAWWGWQLATERRAQHQATALAADLDRYLRETLYAQLSAPQKQAIETIYRAHTLPSPSKRFP